MNSKAIASSAPQPQGGAHLVTGKMKKSSGGSSKKKSSSSSGTTTTTKSSSTNTKQRGVQKQQKFPVEPTVISVVHKPREYMNHSYRDFSQVPAEIGYEPPTNIADMTFSEKVHDILSQPEYKAWIAWHAHGRSFKIFVPQYFERNVCYKYFGHKRYSSFLRCLNNFGFKHITKGPDRNSYYHEFFLEGRPHLCKYMPLCKDARRLVPDPEHEPDFYRISAMYPLKKEEHEQQQQQEQQQGGGGGGDEAWLLNTKKPAAVVGKMTPPPSVTSSSAMIPPSLAAAVPALAGPAASVPSSSAAPRMMTLQSHIESGVSSRMLPVQVAATAAAANNNLLTASPSASASPALGPRLALDVSWLLQQMPPTKIHRPTTPTTAPSFSYHQSAPDATAALLHALDVAQARRAQQQDVAVSTAAAVALARARQRQQQQQLQEDEEEAAAALVAAAVQARQRQEQQQQQQQQRQEAALLAAVQQRKQQIVSRLLGVDVFHSNNTNSSGLNSSASSNSTHDNSSGQDAFLLEYIRQMKQHHDV